MNTITNRGLTTILLRGAGLFVFVRLFDNFAAYVLSVYYSATLPVLQEQLQMPLTKFYFTGTVLLVLNIIISFLLILKAEWLSVKLTSKEAIVHIKISPVELMGVVIFIIGIIWLSSVLLLVPDLTDYLSFKMQDSLPPGSGSAFNPAKFVVRLLLSIFFILRYHRIANFFYRFKDNGST